MKTKYQVVELGSRGFVNSTKVHATKETREEALVFLSELLHKNHYDDVPFTIREVFVSTNNSGVL